MLRCVSALHSPNGQRSLPAVHGEDGAALVSSHLRDVRLAQACGFFDGPQAYGILLEDLPGEENRTKQDKQFYMDAELMQRSHPLQNGCQATEYTKRAMPFLIHIRPNFPQQHTAHDVSDYLVDLMPKALRMEGRGIAERSSRTGGSTSTTSPHSAVPRPDQARRHHLQLPR